MHKKNSVQHASLEGNLSPGRRRGEHAGSPPDAASHPNARKTLDYRPYPQIIPHFVYRPAALERLTNLSAGTWRIAIKEGRVPSVQIGLGGAERSHRGVTGQAALDYLTSYGEAGVSHGRSVDTPPPIPPSKRHR